MVKALDIPAETKKRNALKAVEHAARKRERAESEHHSAMRFASEAGASLREIADAAAVSHQTVKNLLAAREDA